MSKPVTFTIRATMDERWVDHFCSMLQLMQGMGDIGHSGIVGMYAVWDGDFRPEFDISIPFNTVKGKELKDSKYNPKIEVLFDAG